MDSKDGKIVSCLKENSRRTVREIAAKTGLSITTIHYRLRAMEAKGLLKYTCFAERKFAERSLVAYVLIKAMPGVNHESLYRKIRARPEVEEGAIVTGETDILVKVGVKDMDALNAFVLKFLRLFPEVAETRTMICYVSDEKTL